MTENRLFIGNARPTVYASRVKFLGGWVGYCPCWITPIRRRRWRDAYNALHQHVKEIHL